MYYYYINYQFSPQKESTFMTKLRVGVLMGGKSIEREVSFNSGRTICDHLDTQRYTIIPLFQTVANRTIYTSLALSSSRKN